MLEFSSIRDSAPTFRLVIVVFANIGYITMRIIYLLHANRWELGWVKPYN